MSSYIYFPGSNHKIKKDSIFWLCIVLLVILVLFAIIQQHPMFVGQSLISKNWSMFWVIKSNSLLNAGIQIKASPTDLQHLPQHYQRREHLISLRNFTSKLPSIVVNFFLIFSVIYLNVKTLLHIFHSKMTDSRPSVSFVTGP